MVKNRKREVALIDEQGQEWVRALLNAPAIKRIIKLYQGQGVSLEAREIIYCSDSKCCERLERAI